MKKTTHWALLIVTFVALVLGYALYRCARMNQMLKSSLPYLIEGEALPLEKLTSVGSESAREAVLSSKESAVIFIFPRPCTTCATNIVYWNKMQSIFGDKIQVYGIVADSLTNAFNFWEDSGRQKIKFPLFVPDNLKMFLESFRLKLNSAQTILVQKGKVKHLIIGDLDGNSAVDFIKRVRKII